MGIMRYEEGSSFENLVNTGEKLDKLPPLHLRNFNTDVLTGKSPEKILNILIEAQYKDFTVTDNGDIQCEPGRKRSQEDLYRIMKYYYPEITFPILREMLLKMINESHLCSLHCHDINRRIFFKAHQFPNTNWYDGTVQIPIRTDNLGLDIKQIW